MVTLNDIKIKFPPTAPTEHDSYRLLELPPELLKYMDESGNKPRLTIRGLPTDDAVLCTESRTYDLRAVTLSNSILVVTPQPETEDESDPDASNTVVVRDSVSQILEVIPTVPKLQRLDALLKDSKYDEADDDEDVHMDTNAVNRKLYTYEEIAQRVQASPLELRAALTSRRILRVDNYLRPITPSYLTTILTSILNTLVARSLNPSAASVSTICTELHNIQDVRSDVTRQVLSWFGTTTSTDDDNTDTWSVDHEKVVREIGLGLLRPHITDNPISRDAFFKNWMEAVGDTFVAYIDLKLLEGNYLLHVAPYSSDTLTYYPSSALPLEPPARFTDLFLTRAKWKYTDLIPFLSDIAVDTKERDKLLIKYARASTDQDGAIWYTAKTAVF